MDVYTPQNKAYYINNSDYFESKRKGAAFSDNEVMELRKRYVNESANQIYESVKDRCQFQTLQQILWGRHFDHLPIYDKKNKIWINTN